MSDADMQRTGRPVDLDSVSLDDKLLVDTFGIWERRGGGDWKIRIINNFRSNLVNDFAWIPSKLQYSGYGDLKDAAASLKQHWTENICLGKADFKSAYKTLPPSRSQEWLCWSLIFNPVEQKLQVAP